MTKPCEMPCEKCGNTDINRRFYQKGATIEIGFRDKRLPFKGFTKEIASYVHETLKDCISHHCRCCHYEWYSDTKVA